MSRLGVLGGTFDPPHLGHLRAAEVARHALALDGVVFVPAAEPPHKSGDRVTEAKHRVTMLEAALRGSTAFTLSRVELDREGPSYTIDTLQELSRRDPGVSLYFITGSDAFREIATWKRWRELLSSYSFVVEERPGDELSRALEAVPEELSPRVVDWPQDGHPGEREGIFVLRRRLLALSSTELRDTVRCGGSIRFLVPDEVADYVRRHGLYLDGELAT